jgi:hypothetical protein
VAAVYMLSDRNAGAVFDPLDQKKRNCFFFFLAPDLLFRIGYGKQIKVERIRSRWNKMFSVSFYRSPVTTILSTFHPCC